MKKAVFSFFTFRTSGDYSWWDEFPREISKCLKEKGIEHLCFYRDYSEHSLYPVKERHQISHQQMKNTFSAKKIIGPLVKEYDKVILHYHTFYFPCGLWIFNNIFNKHSHWITTDHDLWDTDKFSSLKRQVRILLRRFGFLPEIIIGPSRVSKSRLQQIYGLKNVDFIYNGINIPDVHHPAPLTSKPNKALFVGRLEEYKGLWPLVKAFKIIKDKKIDASLTIAGKGPLHRTLQQYIKNNSLENNINLSEFSKNIEDFYSDNHFLIIPTVYNESFGLVSVEAQSRYLPCIYTPAGGLPETHINYKTGIMVPKDNPEKIVEAIQFFQQDIERFNQMRLAARQNSLNFTMDKMASDYADLYLKIFNR
jgi:glycosyltransferase involved in cell wall biosynthesis